MKKWIVLLSAILCMNAMTWAADIVYRYTFEDNGVRITDVSVIASITSLEIPTWIDGEPVVAIGASAFTDCSQLTSIKLPETLESIGSSAFSSCALTSIEIPNSVTNITDGAFNYCTSLKSVKVNQYVLEEGLRNVFFTYKGSNANVSSSDYLYRSITNVTFTSNVTRISDYAFYECASLSEITLPDDVTYIGEGSFYSCSSLKSIVIPDGVKSIGSSAFAYCSKLTSVTLPDGLTRIGAGAFQACSQLTSIALPETLERIGSSAFGSCALTSIAIPNSVTNITQGAFSFCKNLKSVKVNQYVLDTGLSNVFWNYDGPNANYTDSDYYYRSITNVTFSSNVTRISDNALYYCYSLKEITLPDEVTYIGANSFDHCNSLTSIVIPDGVKSIGSSAFYYCSGLASVTLPEGLTHIGYGAFQNCKKLTAIKLPETLESINRYAFSGCSLTSIEIPNSVTNITQGAFSYCTSLKSVKVNQYVLDSGLRNVFFNYKGSNANYSSSDYLYRSITNVTFSSNVTRISNRAFYECYGLKAIDVPSAVTTIGSYAFAYCSLLQKIVFNGAPPSVASDAFYRVATGCKGYFLPAHESAWEAVIDANGKWAGLIMRVLLPVKPEEPIPLPDVTTQEEAEDVVKDMEIEISAADLAINPNLGDYLKVGVKEVETTNPETGVTTTTYQAVVVVNPEADGVTPTLGLTGVSDEVKAELGENLTEPVVMEPGEKVGVIVNRVVPGLWYGFEAVDDLSKLGKTDALDLGSFKQATATGGIAVKATDKLFPKKGFYRVKVLPAQPK